MRDLAGRVYWGDWSARGYGADSRREKMGIKFRCPNGHKLNVKSFLAGKKGVCPKCGTSMRIPSASTEGGDSDVEQGAAAVGVSAAAVDPAGPNGALHPALAAAQPTIPAAPAGPANVRPVGAPAAPVGIPVGSPAMTAAPIAALPRPAVAMPAHAPALPRGAPAMPAMPLPPAVAAGDPIAEAPAASWYVRPPSGVQYGPARGDVMRKWIAEGRVSSDSLVWREGWADWKNAGQLFPHLASAGGPSASAPSVPTTPASRIANRYQAKKKSGSGMAVAFLVVLALVCAGLVGVLVYVLTTAK